MQKKINDNIINIQFVFIVKQIINKFIKTLYFDKFVIFYNIFEMKTISKHFIKI